MAIITRKFELDSAYLATVLGTADENLRVLNNQLDADIFARGHVITVTGPAHEVARAKKVLE